MEDLVISKLNGPNNDLRSVEIERFPTIMLFMKGKGDTPVEYTGSLSRKKLRKWLKKQLGEEWQAKPKQEDTQTSDL